MEPAKRPPRWFHPSTGSKPGPEGVSPRLSEPLDEGEGDLGNLAIKLWVNGELMQDSSSSNLIFSVAEQISHLSTRLTLRPGDVIATGTPAGCGAARGRFAVRARLTVNFTVSI